MYIIHYNVYQSLKSPIEFYVVGSLIISIEMFVNSLFRVIKIIQHSSPDILDPGYCGVISLLFQTIKSFFLDLLLFLRSFSVIPSIFSMFIDCSAIISSLAKIIS